MDIVIFTSQWCRVSGALKKQMQEANIPFKEVDITSSKGNKLGIDLDIKATPTIYVLKKPDDFSEVEAIHVGYRKAEQLKVMFNTSKI